MSRRLLIGALPDGNYGLRVAKAGFDAGAVPPVPQDLIFDSNWPALLPIHVVGQVNFGQGNTTVNFSALDYFPLTSLFLLENSRSSTAPNRGYPNIPALGPVIATGGTYSYLNTLVTKSQILIDYVINSSYQTTFQWSSNWTLYYVVYKVPSGL